MDRAHVERTLYDNTGIETGAGTPVGRNVDAAYLRYWGSRVPVLDYCGGYTLPQLVIFSPIAKERLHVEWTKPVKEVWERVKEVDRSPDEKMRMAS